MIKAKQALSPRETAELVIRLHWQCTKAATAKLTKLLKAEGIDPQQAIKALESQGITEMDEAQLEAHISSL